MIERTSVKKSGAPLQALFLLVVFWTLGRVYWEADFSNTAATSAEQDRQTSRPEKSNTNDSKRFVPTDTGGPIPDIFHSAVVLGPEPGKHPSAGWSGVAPTLVRQKPGTDQTPETRFLNSTADRRPHEDKKTSVRHKQGSEVARQMRLAPTRGAKENPFSVYMWVYARQNSGSPGNGPNFTLSQQPGSQLQGPRYGGSQAGALISYQLRGNQKRGLSLFLRGSTALSVSGEEELAVGTKIKPFPDIPVSLYAEQRVGNAAQRNRGTAVYLAGGTGPDHLLENISFQTYAQAGYVFGPPDSYFFDASVAVQKNILHEGGRATAIGGGLWAGGQKGVSRVDIGPRATINVPVGRVNTSISADWRWRLAGDAVPGTGAAITLVAGF